MSNVGLILFSVLLGPGRIFGGDNFCRETTSSRFISSERLWLLDRTVRHCRRRLRQVRDGTEFDDKFDQERLSGRRADRRRTTPTGTPTSQTAGPTRTASSSREELMERTSGMISPVLLSPSRPQSFTVSVSPTCKAESGEENFILSSVRYNA